MHAAAQLLKISDISRSPGLWSRQDVFQACGRGVRRQHEGPLCWTTRTTPSNSERRAPPGPAGAPGDGQAGKSPRQEHEHARAGARPKRARSAAVEKPRPPPRRCRWALAARGRKEGRKARVVSRRAAPRALVDRDVAPAPGLGLGARAGTSRSGGRWLLLPGVGRDATRRADEVGGWKRAPARRRLVHPAPLFFGPALAGRALLGDGGRLTLKRSESRRRGRYQGVGR